MPGYAVQEQAGLENPAAILYGTNDLRHEHHPIPADIPPGYVRVLMRAVGICGSDVHFYKKVSLQQPPHENYEVPLRELFLLSQTCHILHARSECCTCRGGLGTLSWSSPWSLGMSLLGTFSLRALSTVRTLLRSYRRLHL